MSIYDEIRKRIVECMKAGESEERDVLKTLVGEIQAKVSREPRLHAAPESDRSPDEVSDDLVIKTLTAFKENALVCHEAAVERGQDDSLSLFEIGIYDKFLPRFADVDEIIALLESSADQLRSAKADGPATGMAMGILKKTDAKIQGKDVSEAVKRIRA